MKLPWETDEKKEFTEEEIANLETDAEDVKASFEKFDASTKSSSEIGNPNKI
jgi:hypothetical protein